MHGKVRKIFFKLFFRITKTHSIIEPYFCSYKVNKTFNYSDMMGIG